MRYLKKNEENISHLKNIEKNENKKRGGYSFSLLPIVENYRCCLPPAQHSTPTHPLFLTVFNVSFDHPPLSQYNPVDGDSSLSFWGGHSFF